MPNQGGTFRPKERGGVLLYRRIESLIRTKILSGQYEAEEMLPKEDSLAEDYGVSKITVRNALAGLEADGLIDRIPGRGTFVARDIQVKKQYIVTGSIYDIVRDATRYGVTTLGIDDRQVRDTRYPKELRKFLGLKNEDTVAVVRRMRALTNTPMFFLENFIPHEVAAHLTIEELDREPLLQILKRKIGLSLGRGEMFIESVPADPDVAEILEGQIFDPLIVIKAHYWFASGRPFEIVNLFMKAEYFKYQVKLDKMDF